MEHERRKHRFFQATKNSLEVSVFIRVIRGIRGKNAGLFLTTDSADFTDKIAGRVSHQL
jgi:hypothetical protein